MARYSEAHNKAHQKWAKENLYAASIYFPITEKPVIQERAKPYGSVNAYINSLVQNDINKNPIIE